eukprot:15453810-Alexandrium_andersonii.AAC.1
MTARESEGARAEPRSVLSHTRMGRARLGLRGLPEIGAVSCARETTAVLRPAQDEGSLTVVRDAGSLNVVPKTQAV